MRIYTRCRICNVTCIKLQKQIQLLNLQANDKLLLRLDRPMLSENLKLTAKLGLAKTMLGARLETLYNASKENQVNQIKENKH